MNFTLDKKKCIYIVIWLLIGLLSFTVLGKYASAPESHQATIASLDEKKATVLELTAATTATSALITLLPGDIGTPIAEKVADLSGYLLIVLCAVFLEKYLVTITGYAAFKIFIPAAGVLFAANMMARNRSVDKLARRLLIFGICIFLVVPASVKVSDLIETTYQSQIDATLEDAKSTQIVKEAPNALYVIVSNPVDIMTYVFTKISGLPERQIIGSGTILDTARLRCGLSEQLQVAQKNIHAYVFGEHGDTSFIP